MEQWKQNLLCLWIAGFLIMAAWTSIMPFLPLFLTQELGVEGEAELKFWTGIIFGINFLSMMLVSPIWGKVADKYGRKLMLIRSGIGIGIIIALMGIARTPLHLFFLRLINGTVAGFVPASIALVSTNTPEEKVGFALGTLQAGVVAGSILGPFLGGILAEVLGFRQIFYVSGLVLLAITISVVVFVKETNKPAANESNTSMIADFRTIFSVSSLVTMFTTGFLIQFALFSTNPFLLFYVQEVYPDEAMLSFLTGLAVSVTGFASMLAAPVFGKLGDKFGSQYVLFYNLLGTAFFLIPHIFVVTYWQLLICRFLLGISMGGLLPSVNALIHHFSPKGLESSTYAYSNSFINMGMMLGPIVGGYLGGLIGIRGLFVVASFLFVLSIFWFKRSLVPAKIHKTI